MQRPNVQATLRQIMTNAKEKEQAKLAEGEDLFTRAHKEWEQGRLKHAFRLLREGANVGHPESQNALGYFYDVGVGIKPDRAAAMYWYKRAFRKGNKSAIINIGTIYRDEKKPRRALVWFLKALKQHDTDVHLEIGKIYIALKEKRKAAQHLKKVWMAQEGSVCEESREEALLLWQDLVGSTR